MEKTVLTAAGRAELEKQLEYLKTVTRKEVAEQIRIAREFGDLSENAEYDEAKNEQSRIEGEILHLEQQLRNAIVIDEDTIDTNVVSLGAFVTVMEAETGEEYTYSIVGATEADPMEGRLSNESPVGAGLLGHAVDETVDINTPGGVCRYIIKSIHRG
ncbi:MAG: transcription elongation factor GreA [Clostridia bacterium]|nr:transcription elongation factor GreA [Clostridia bacterium]